MTRPDATKGEKSHWHPSVLPGARGVLFTIMGPDGAEPAQVAVLDLKTGQWKTLIRGGSQAEYVQTGHLVYAAAGTLRAVRFDLERLEVLGDPVPVVDDVWIASTGAAGYAVARPGTLVYVPAAGMQTLRSIVWVDRRGHETPIRAPLRVYAQSRLSPDGRRVALEIRDQEHDLHIWDLARELLTQLTLDPSVDWHPVWTLDGQRIVFASQRAGASLNLFALAADGSGAVERLTTGANPQTPAFVAPDGTGVLGTEQSAKAARDIVWFPLKNPANRSGAVSDAGPSRVEPLIRTTAIESNPELSPGGRYLAYQSNESGRNEIYVRPFPRVNDRRWHVSTDGGTRPAWARNGRELFYLDLANTLTAVPVQTSGATFAAGNPARVFETAYAAPHESRPYDVSPDGQRFLMIKANVSGHPARAGMVVVLNWHEELKAKLAAK